MVQCFYSLFCIKVLCCSILSWPWFRLVLSWASLSRGSGTSSPVGSGSDLNLSLILWKSSEPASMKSRTIEAIVVLAKEVGTSQPVTDILSDHIDKSVSKSINQRAAMRDQTMWNVQWTNHSISQIRTLPHSQQHFWIKSSTVEQMTSGSQQQQQHCRQQFPNSPVIQNGSRHIQTDPDTTM